MRSGGMLGWLERDRQNPLFAPQWAVAVAAAAGATHTRVPTTQTTRVTTWVTEAAVPALDGCVEVCGGDGGNRLAVVAGWRPAGDWRAVAWRRGWRRGDDGGGDGATSGSGVTEGGARRRPSAGGWGGGGIWSVDRWCGGLLSTGGRRWRCWRWQWGRWRRGR